MANEEINPTSVLKNSLIDKYGKSLRHTENQLCTGKCLHNNVEKLPMTRCCLCAHWFHDRCVNIKKGEQGIWACYECRFISHDISQLQTTVNKLLHIIETQQTQIDTISMKQNSIETKQTTVNENVNIVKNNVESLSANMIPDIYSDSDSEDSDSDSEDELEPEGHLLIGDSIIRDVDPTSDDLSVHCLRGAKFPQIRKKIHAIKGKMYKDLTIIGGTNDCATNKPPEKIVDDCRETIKVAKTKSENVRLSSILPRCDNRVDATKIDTVNQLMIGVAAEEDVTFVNNDSNFRYRDDSTDESALSADGLHLSSKGTSRLLSNLELAEKACSSLSKGPTNRWDSNQPLQPQHHQQQDTQSRSHSSTNTAQHTAGWQSSHHRQTDKLKPWPGIRQLPHLKRQRLFRGGHDPLSNFHLVSLHVYQRFFKSLEHAYQWRKGKYLRMDSVAERIAMTKTPREAKDIADNELQTNGSNWYYDKKLIMHDLLIAKSEQCPAFVQALLQSGQDDIVEDTNHPYWARGKNGQGQNMLGKLLMIIRDGLTQASNPTQSLESYRPPANGVSAPCMKCGEGNHNSIKCRYQGFLRCRQCHFDGHKCKHCPDRL